MDPTYGNGVCALEPEVDGRSFDCDDYEELFAGESRAFFFS